MARLWRSFLIMSLALGSLVSGCSLSHSSGEDTSAAPDAAPARRDAWTALDACIEPAGETGWVSAETGACLGLAEAGCASCHAREGGFDLRPRGVAPPPASTPPLMPGSCGLCRP
jgi:hypothetical protein